MLPSKFILLTALFVNLAPSDKTWFVSLAAKDIAILWNSFQGISYLLYPLCGWLADTYTTNFKIIVGSFLVSIASSIIVVGLGVAYFCIDTVDIYLAWGLPIVLGLIGLGMYEANAIQFGMDQMTEASSEQLSAFIHWYYWCAHLAPALYYYLLIGVYLFVRNCVIKDQWNNLLHVNNAATFFFPSILQFTLLVSCLILAAYYKKCMYSVQAKNTYFKLIFGVIRYSFKHKYPVMRSAFTYWENFTPSRLDLGKQKYGGPYSTEEVEDVKTFLRLLLLIFSLFGYQFTGDGYSLVQYVIKMVGCPTVGPMVTLFVNPNNISVMIALILIPLYQLILKHKIERYLPNLLNRIGIGMLFCLLSQFLSCLTSIYVNFYERDTIFTCHRMKPNALPTLTCFVANMKVFSINGTCEYFCEDLPKYDTAFILPIISFLLNGMSQLLVFLTVLEFICAQAPKGMKGFLIGIWYSQLFLKTAVINSLDESDFFQQKTNWDWYNGAKGIGIFISIVAFSLVSKWYRYRERDEVVNEQAIIEELYERELLLNHDDDSQCTFSINHSFD